MVLQRSLIIGAEHLITDWEPRTPEQLRPDHFAAIMAMKPEVLLLGTGSRICFPAPALFAPLMEAGIGWEVMDNAAAGRTYNVLNGDGRQVVAALLIP